MLKMSRMVEYGILILTHLSKLGDGEKMSAREISNAYNLPFPTVSKILKQLAKENAVISIQGSKGGYMITENTEKITLKTLIEALDGSSNVVTCMSETVDCEYVNDCSAKGSMTFIDREVTKVFEKITLRELLTKSNADTN